jgi:hypothetical protein
MPMTSLWRWSWWALALYSVAYVGAAYAVSRAWSDAITAAAALAAAMLAAFTLKLVLVTEQEVRVTLQSVALERAERQETQRQADRNFAEAVKARLDQTVPPVAVRLVSVTLHLIVNDTTINRHGDPYSVPNTINLDRDGGDNPNLRLSVQLHFINHGGVPYVASFLSPQEGGWNEPTALIPHQNYTPIWSLDLTAESWSIQPERAIRIEVVTAPASRSVEDRHVLSLRIRPFDVDDRRLHLRPSAWEGDRFAQVERHYPGFTP